jgi:regulatory protein
VPEGIITAIEPSARRAGRFDLAVEGTIVARLSIDSVERLGLRVGCAVTGPLATRIVDEASVVRSYDRGIDILAVRPRASADLRRTLIKKGDRAASVDQAIARLQAAGFLDDDQFARQFARAKALGAGASKRRIEQELRRRGVAGTAATRAIEDTFRDEQIDDQTSIERVATKKLRMLSRLDPATQRRRLYAFLARRGYDSDTIGATVRRLVGSIPSP